jgi:hypothetical protein
MKTTDLWNVAPCNVVYRYQRFGIIFCLLSDYKDKLAGSLSDPVPSCLSPHSYNFLPCSAHIYTLKMKAVYILQKRLHSLSIYLWLYSHLFDLGHFFSSLIVYTVGRNPWPGDQPVARPPPAQDNTNRINAHRHRCLKWDSNIRSQCLSGRRQFMP